MLQIRKLQMLHKIKIELGNTTKKYSLILETVLKLFFFEYYIYCHETGNTTNLLLILLVSITLFFEDKL